MSLQKGVNSRECVYTRLSVQTYVEKCRRPHAKVSVSLQEGVDNYQCPYEKISTVVSIPAGTCGCRHRYRKVLTGVTECPYGKVSVFIRKKINRCQCPYQKVWTGVGVSQQDGAKKCQRLDKKSVDRCGCVSTEWC